MTLRLNQTQKGIPSKPADACSNYIRNSISKWAVCGARPAHHHADNLPPLPFFKELKKAERMVSDSFREVSAQFNITCFGQRVRAVPCTHIKTVLSESNSQNQFCAALFSHTSNKQSQAIENSEMFFGNIKQDSFTQCPVGARDIKNIYPLGASCTSPRSVRDVDLSTQIWLRQALSSPASADIWRCQWETHDFLL